MKNSSKANEILSSWLKTIAEKEQIPGLNILIGRANEELFKSSFGFADVETQTVMEFDKLFMIASISKMFTAVAVLQLCEAKKINLDDTLNDHLKLKTKDKNFANIRIRSVLNHTAGIIRDGNSNKYWDNEAGPTQAELIQDIAENSVIFPQQKHFKYSNYGYALLGMLIEIVSEMSYAEYITTNILNPAGLTNTYFDYSDKLDKLLASPYHRNLAKGKFTKFAKTLPMKAVTPAAGIVSNILDLGKFLTVLTSSQKLLSDYYLNEMLRIQWYEGNSSPVYGYGMETVQNPVGKLLVGHGGLFNGYSSRITYDKETKLWVIIMTNRTGLDKLLQDINASIHDLVEFLNEKDMGKSKLNYEKFTGHYQSNWGDAFIVQLGKDLYWLEDVLYPASSVDKLIPTKVAGKFIFPTFSGYGMTGEKVYFDTESAKAKFIEIGAVRYRRVGE